MFPGHPGNIGSFQVAKIFKIEQNHPEREAFNLKWHDIPRSMQFFMAKKIELHSLVSKTHGFKDKDVFGQYQAKTPGKGSLDFKVAWYIWFNAVFHG